jgi:uncharacterized protein YyaL (SSP411 family)
MSNRLAQETSPYLLQHAENPVDWYPWGEEALARAEREDKPIFLSIGYAACHWCHVMEHESFEDETVAALLNRHFVSIKVDREERPDLDDIYMAATMALSGSGGWPMSVFLAPDRRPFFAGTYFPPNHGRGRPGFSTLLKRIADLWQNQRDDLLAQANALASQVRAGYEIAAATPVSSKAISAAVRSLAASFDPEWGGFGSAPKFPPAASISLLLRHHAKTGDTQALAMATSTLDGMKNGGIYDHLGGGFARYSTDERWLVPHFEKMLYDNAGLARVYLQAYQATHDPEYRRVGRETLDYVVLEMQAGEGGYHSATDADSEGEEGKFFVWTLDEIQGLLDPASAKAFALFYDVTLNGNWEGKNVLHRPRSIEAASAELSSTPEALQTLLEAAREKLCRARLARVPPLLDDKVITAWNGLMIGAMAEGFRVLRDPRYLDSAERAARFVLSALRRPDGGLFRTARAGRAHLPGCLDDYAYLSDALITLFEAGGSAEFLAEALRLAERASQDFGDGDGAFFTTARDHETLFARPREGQDGALPNANAVLARALARLARHYDRDDLAQRARAAITAYGVLIEQAPRAFATSLAVLDFVESAPIELAVVGRRGAQDREAIEFAIAECYLPNCVFAHFDPDQNDATDLSLLRGKTLVRGHAALYVCRNYVCAAPVTDAAAATAALTAQ